MHGLWVMIVGVCAGGAARMLLRGARAGGIAVMMLLGIEGALMGNSVANVAGWHDRDAAGDWLVMLPGATVPLAVYGFVTRRPRRNQPASWLN